MYLRRNQNWELFVIYQTTGFRNCISRELIIYMCLKYFTEKIASELQRFLENNHLELDSTPAGEESVFNTITSQMGIDFSSTLQGTFRSPAETPDILNGGMGGGKRDTTENHNVLLMYNEMASEE